MIEPYVQVALQGDIPAFDEDHLRQAISEVLHLSVDQIRVRQSSSEVTDQQLWHTVNLRLNPEEQTQLEDLMEANNERKLTSQEQARLGDLVQKVNHQMQSRSDALAELQARGYDIHGYLGLRN